MNLKITIYFKKFLQELEDLKVLFDDLKFMTKDNRLKEALRYFRNALYVRNMRLDLSKNIVFYVYNVLKVKTNQFTRKCYVISSHPFWNFFLCSVSWIYAFLAFFEPANKKDIEHFGTDGNAEFLITTEFIIIFLFLLDTFMEMIHRKLKQKHTNFAVSFMINKKFYLKILINVLFLADSINFYINIESEVLRFSRPLRPCINPSPSFIFIIFFF